MNGSQMDISLDDIFNIDFSCYLFLVF
jgi:hypothetical protein